jgi:predicted aspartyl protease/tetratricopeptide (TPR) repeat protein
LGSAQTRTVQAATRKLISSGGRCGAAAYLALSLLISPSLAAAKCQLTRVVELPITMSGQRPTLMAQINGADARFILDSGAFYSVISTATAAQFQLRLKPGPFGLKVNGVGGSADTSLATVKAFTLAGIPLHDVEFLVGGGEAGDGSVGLLGQNFLEKWDVEYDFAHGVVRLFKAEDCKHTLLAYWTTSGQDNLSMMDIDHTTPLRPHTTGIASVNGAKITVLFDTGAWSSVLSMKAAARAGVKVDTPGVVEAGYAVGIGRSSVPSYIAPFASFKIGDGEEIKNARLRMADINLDEGDMLLGADFFLSHHVYVANSQHRLYFTYNGGPVFDLTRKVAAKAAAAEPATAAPAAQPDVPSGTPPAEPADAAAFARRGAAFAGRRDFEHAIVDFTRACELNPNEPEFAFQRGMAYWQDRQPVPAMNDLDRALTLNSGYLPARMSRAELRLAEKDRAGATADLDAADQIAPKQADERFRLAELYLRFDLPARAVPQFDLWIANHPNDSKIVEALHGRCWVRAVQGQGLAEALSDCNAAYRQSDKTNHAGVAAVLASRGLVRLRLGNYDKAIADYDDSLKLAPKNPWSLYGRGVAKIRMQKKADGEADLARATELSGTIAQEFQRRGITP